MKTKYIDRTFMKNFITTNEYFYTNCSFRVVKEEVNWYG